MSTTLHAACDFQLWTLISILPILAAMSCSLHAALDAAWGSALGCDVNPALAMNSCSLHVNHTTLDAAWDIQLWTVISGLPALAVIPYTQQVNNTTLDAAEVYTALVCDIKFASLSCNFLHAAGQQHNTGCCWRVYSSGL